MFFAALRMLRQKGYIKDEDKIAYLSGSFGEGGGTTFLEINKVGEAFERHYKFHLPGDFERSEAKLRNSKQTFMLLYINPQTYDMSGDYFYIVIKKSTNRVFTDSIIPL